MHRTKSEISKRLKKVIVYLNELVAVLEAAIAKLTDRELLVESTLSRNNRSIGCQGEMDTRIRDQVCLELVQIHVEGSVET